MRRELRLRIFLGSTTEEIEQKVGEFCLGTCPGNLVDSKLYKLGSVYQFVVWYAELVDEHDEQELEKADFQ